MSAVGSDVTRGGADAAVSLSVVVVARNEEGLVADCLESVQAACTAAGRVDESAVDVVLVDSNSTDRTVEISAEYPVSVYRIPRDDLCSCGAGRHVGFQRSRGDYTLFVDGDMVLDTHWLDTAVGVLERQDDVAGVDGWLTDRRGGCGEVSYLRGVALYESAAIEEVGGFDPRIDGLGDVDMGLRLRSAGYRLVRLPVVVATHPASSGVGERIRRWREGYYRSNGQVLRKSLGDPDLLAKWLYRFRLPLSVTAWLVVGLALAVTLRFDLLAGWGAMSAAGFVAVAAVRGVRWTASKFTLRLGLFLAGLVVGFYRGPSPAEYPMDEVETVKRGPVADARR